jgi:hypothetical protein
MQARNQSGRMTAFQACSLAIRQECLLAIWQSIYLAFRQDRFLAGCHVSKLESWLSFKLE